ncbi:amidohydrolase [Steroidobacter agaridevorans]|uniref:Amidohydrolase n=1 Tax=Steroidobacter agaridevorans TaxID=2695856 RepID=A0A829Y5F7_9GAMM|nr:amidohydrolase [Steroidobacter agaridevorans]GFE78437.1 amidohydrolase [Steroidobacter agaridevorans]
MRVQATRLLVLAIAGLAAACSKQEPPAASAAAADIVFKNGHIYTVDPASPTATWIAVSGGKIAALGNDEATQALIGPDTRVIDLQGKLLLPAFHDAHTHPVWGGLSHSGCNLYDGNSPEDYQKIVAKCAAEEPGDGWIYGSGWKDGLFPPDGVPDKKLLDAVVPNRPVAFTNVGGHGIWVNSKALEVAGITRATKDPQNGRIDRDKKGDPIGSFQEAAVKLIVDKLPPPSDKAREQALGYARDYFNSNGIVGWHDALVPIGGGEAGQSIPPGVPETYATMAKNGALKGHVRLALAWDAKRGVEQVADLIAAADKLSAAGVSAKSVKFLLDGVPAQRTAALIEPYSDMPNFKGDLHIEPAVLKDAVTRLDAEGFQVHIHAIGDQAVRTALDAFTQARDKNGAKDHRHLLSHVNLISKEDLPRFKDLGVVVIFQPLWACMDDYMVMVRDRVGSTRMEHMYPVMSLLKAGGKVAYGSDWPVASANPLEGIEVALTRLAPGTTSGEMLAPDERVTLEQAIQSYTIDSAYASHLDDRSGSLVVGKSADLVVLDHDLFRMPANEIAKTKVLLTMFAGEAVHGDLALVPAPVENASAALGRAAHPE